jgi:hypothetical protein
MIPPVVVLEYHARRIEWVEAQIQGLRDESPDPNTWVMRDDRVAMKYAVAIEEAEREMASFVAHLSVSDLPALMASRSERVRRLAVSRLGDAT